MGILVYRDRDGKRDLVGRIDYERGQDATFSYSADYLARAKQNAELGISERLPLDSAPYTAAELGPFFRGLLPEGAVYDNLVEMYQVARNDYLALLEQLGCESIGALTFVSESVDPFDYQPRYEPLTEQAIDALRSNPLRAVTRETSSTRLSLAGAQTKVAWFLSRGISPESARLSDWSIPRGTAPSSHIIKLARRGEEELALNEVACSLLARACGIDIAEASLLPELPGAVAVKRYDRVPLQEAAGEGPAPATPAAGLAAGLAATSSTPDNSPLMRLHQEDFCQALGFPPYLKYQPDSNEGDYVLFCSHLIDATCANPRDARIEFGKRLAFNFAVGNADAHLKNSALLYSRDWRVRSLAPLYDVTCIPLTGYSTKMPFEVGQHRLLQEIDEKDVTSIALDLGLSLEDFDVALRAVIEGLEAPDAAALESAGSDVAAMADKILQNSAPRVAVLKRYLGM